MSFFSSQSINDSLIHATGLQTQIPSGGLSVRCDWMFRLTGSCRALLAGGEDGSC